MHKVFEHHVVAMCFHRLHRSYPYKISPFVFHGKKIWSEWVNDGCFYFWVNYPHGLCYCSEVNIEREIHQLSTQQSDMFTFWSLSVTRPPLCSSTQTGCISLANLRALESRSQNIWGFLAVSKHYGLKMSECHCIRYYYNIKSSLHICIQMCKIFYLS